jgi:hypothetical protein
MDAFGNLTRTRRLDGSARSFGWKQSAPALRCAMASAHPARDRIERGAIEFPVVDVGDADGTASCFQFWPHLRQLDRQLVGSLGGHIHILEDDGPLVLELFVKHETGAGFLTSAAKRG